MVIYFCRRKKPLLGADFLCHFELMVDMRHHQLVDMSNFATSPLEIARNGYQVRTVTQISSGDPYADLMARFPQLSKPK